VVAVSAETRFTSAYTAVRMLADIGLHANGYRTRSSVPGHHVIAIESLVLQAEALHTRTRNWLRKHKPALLRAVKT
jgi:hypothetical protein